jgi:hypothetical protein
MQKKVYLRNSGQHFYSTNGIMSNTLDDFPSIVKSKMKYLDNSICIGTNIKTIKPMVSLLATNDADTLNQAQEQIRQGNRNHRTGETQF